MDSKIFYGILILSVISTGTAFAQEAIISIQSDDNHYDEGDTIVISGNVQTVIEGTPIIIQIFTEGTLVDIAQITVAQDGTFSDTFLAEGAVWKKAGTYVVRASYQEHLVETEFSYSPETDIPETRTNFEVDAGSHGTFDVEYTIKGGTVEDMVVDSDIFALIVQIEALDEGVITLELPREFIGAEKQDGKDDTFIILIDGIEVPYEEAAVHSDKRVLTIGFEMGDSDIEIIGTYVVPEFANIVMLVLIVGITITILATRNRIPMKI